MASWACRLGLGGSEGACAERVVDKKRAGTPSGEETREVAWAEVGGEGWSRDVGKVGHAVLWDEESVRRATGRAVKRRVVGLERAGQAWAAMRRAG